MLAFAHQNWTECLRNIAVVGYYDPAINLGAKRLQLQCQIEKRDMDSAHTSIHAFNMYLRRMEPQFAQLQFINEKYLQAFRLILRAIEKSNKESTFTELDEVLQAHPLMPEMEWFVSIKKD
jgi:hypothetical protein